jgi:8-oxo-dGTP diphosphatase
MLMNLRYTLCFLFRDEQVLMLHRQKPPNRGLWNGVGGHLEPGESARACVLREVYEETGYRLPDAAFRGLLTWEGFETPPGGLYIFTAQAPAGEPLNCPEGELAWKPLDWVLSAPQVVSNIAVFGPHVFGGAAPQQYYFCYQDGQIARYEIRALPAGLVFE